MTKQQPGQAEQPLVFKGLEKTIKEAVGSVLQMTTATQQDKSKPQQQVSLAEKASGAVQTVGKVVKAVLNEAVILMPRTFIMRSENQSATTKENHEKLYKSYVDSFNKISAKLDTVSRGDADNSNDSEFRRLKVDENHNMNGVKLHELYFTNVGDPKSEIRADSIPFMRLSRDWGTFDAWQLDFRACGMAAREGWAVCYFDPFKNQYFNCFIEAHNLHVPLMGIPVLVVDTWHHAWFYDFPGEKLEYMNKSMREINWEVVEMRMMAAEMSKLGQIYAIQPVATIDKSVGFSSGSEPPVEVSAMGAELIK